MSKKKRVLKNIFKGTAVTSNKFDKLKKLKDTAESFNKVACKAAVDLLTTGLFNKRTMVKQIKVESIGNYELKIDMYRPALGGLSLTYICINPNGETVVEFTKTYKATSRVSTVERDFGKITESIKNL